MQSKMDLGTAAYDGVEEIVAKNQRLVQQLNTGIHSANEVLSIVSQITNERIDGSTEIRLPFQTDFGRNLHIGKKVFINSGSMFVDLGGIYIGDHVLIGPNVTIASVNHRLEPSERRNLDLDSVCIHNNAWLGANVMVTPGVIIGENAVVAAGAVVTRDVPPNAVVAGIPARVIKVIKNTKEDQK
ncbi:DapH/DapD/GlmU-related protein [Pediococcus pentosaceus]|uniref:Sugar O-acetyltransferase n=1 Tax=Pediococcus pentosaceus TaxID=1255 RepID=A0AB73HDX9_PEDPE|nr:DapH/DapD/GlmU-related protein [Pediococcus pentosaceus]MBF7114270.1 sugar O-acetyltransferase [Pediococcus pentosaceus]MCM6792058.1 sugar O-acetyltransferase [Pediococcus pentosaceus]MCM6809354.1 sugar O-acetyltransferase [Pediococcus pentosaceus]MCM6812275.1 sugar O-acetyltransferase [Pediococcus pentosaceus]MCM6818784.1 sugar O-acetyltransferase [Pediococcus pentosaceus]